MRAQPTPIDVRPARVRDARRIGLLMVAAGSEVVDRDGLAVVPPDDGVALDGLAGRPFADVLEAVRAAARRR